MFRRVVIVGASVAGLSAAEALRRRGYDGAITLIGGEPHPPYDRPPLSKQVLSGTWEPARVRLRDERALADLGATFLLGHTATGLDVAARKVSVDGGGAVDYDRLVIATGATPRRLPDAELAGIHVFRTVDDAVALRRELLAGPRVVVVGAGFLGCEVAAVARGLGLAVTMVDPLPTPMHRQFGATIGGLVGDLHRAHGVVVRCGVGVSRFVAEGGRVAAVELTDDTRLPADVVLVAVGAVPATSWLADSGVPLGNGVECDACCQAAPDIYAAGDVASWHNPHFGTRMRVEHRMNATEQAMAVAANLLGDNRPFAPVPFFWTDQYDTKLQAYGTFPPNAEPQVAQGDPREGRFITAFADNGVVTGVLGWNAPPKELRTLRQQVVDRTPVRDACAG